MLSARDPVRRRQPVERPLDIVALELLVSVTQALLAGILLALATQLGGDARAYGLPVPGLLAILGIAVGVGWLRWLMGGSGWIMGAMCLAISILVGALWLLSLDNPTLPRIDPLLGTIAVACAIYGLVAAVFLDGPHRAHWKGGVSQPHRGVVQTRATPARFSPPVQKVVDDHLSDLHLPKVTLPSAPSVKLPTIKRPGEDAVSPVPEPAAGDGLALAAAVAPHAPGPSDAPEDVDAIAPEPAVAPEPAPSVADATAVVEAPAPEPAVAPEAASEAATDAVPNPATTGSADPEAPTEPVARPAAQWPRPIEPRGHTGAHPVDPDT